MTTLRDRYRGCLLGGAVGDPFSLGCQAAALTHGHASGYLAAGALALMVSELIRGRDLRAAAATAITRLQQADDGEEVTAALTIVTHCALTAGSFRSGVLHAVNHDGDSDSTGAICGNLLGAALGAAAIDGDLLAQLEGRNVITQVADDLHDVFAGRQSPDSQRYPV